VGGTFITMKDTCAGSGEGALVSELPGRFGGYSNLEGGNWFFNAPTGTSVARYTVHVTGSYAEALEGGGAGSDAVSASDLSDPTYDWRSLGGGSLGPVTINREPPDTVTYVWFGAGCDAPSSACATSGQPVAHIYVSSATFLLNDGSTPKVANLSGSLVSGKPVGGNAEASYEASDGAPGIYAAHFVVDGQAQPSALLDSGQATCKNLGETENGTRAFDSPEPCAPSVAATSTLETAAWPDGEHHVQLIVEDAAGNSTVAFNGIVTFHNAPDVEHQPPSPSAPGTASPFGSVSSNTTTINANTTNNGAGASGYVPAVIELSGQTGRWLKSRGGITRSYPRSALTLSGRLVTPSGAPLGGQTVYLLSGPQGGGLRAIAHALTDPNGEWTLRAARGASRLLRVAYGPQEATAAGSQYTRDIVEHVRPTVKLSVSSYGAGILAFLGHVGFASLKPALLALIQAQAHGRWQDVGAPGRVSAKGQFHARYSAGALVGRTYSFRLLIPGTRVNLRATSRPVSATVR
jgi:hypothetical protein